MNKYKIVRIILSHNKKNTKNILKSFIKKAYSKCKFEFIVTPGRFLDFEWPKQIKEDELKTGDKKCPYEISTDCNSFKYFTKNGQAKIKAFFKNIGKYDYKKLQKIADYITIGIDSDAPKEKNNIELVAIYDLKKSKIIHWTGKFYPTPNQQTRLIRIKDIKSHFIKLNNQKIVILGCNDLIVYSNRGKSASKPGGWRRKIANEFKKRCKKFKPSIVIQHPHTTDSTRIWNSPWKGLEKENPNVKHYASGINYDDINNKGKPREKDINKILENTKKGDVIDYYNGELRIGKRVCFDFQ